MSKILGVVAGLSCLAGAIACYRITSWVSRKKVERRLRRGNRKEAVGEKVLRRHGYSIEATQPPLEARVKVDGRVKKVQIRPDHIVRRSGRRYVAEIKSGEVAPDPLYRDTRRQLLEYSVFSKIDGLLLVDAEQQRIQEITFLPPKPLMRRPTGWIFAFLLGGGVGIALGRQL